MCHAQCLNFIQIISQQALHTNLFYKFTIIAKQKQMQTLAIPGKRFNKTKSDKEKDQKIPVFLNGTPGVHN